MKIWKDKELILNILVPVLLGILVGFLIMPSINDYQKLLQPSLSPPNYLFSLVWIILYILMGISFYLISTTNSFKKKRASDIYFTQLFVNLLWPIIFFTFKLRFFAFIWIIILIILVTMMIFEFYKIYKKAAYLQIPYLLWILFAAYLNFSIYWLNR